MKFVLKVTQTFLSVASDFIFHHRPDFAGRLRHGTQECLCYPLFEQALTTNKCLNILNLLVVNAVRHVLVLFSFFGHRNLFVIWNLKFLNP